MNAQQAAAQTRARIVRKIRKEMKAKNYDQLVDGGCLVQWILNMDARQNKKRGGLGRK